MSGQDKSFERVNQKKRTRTELLRSARELAGQGRQPSVAEVADHAGISRATAYRYFSAAEDLLREAVLDGVATSIHVEPFSGAASRLQLESRLADLVKQVFDMVTANEAMFRALLAGSTGGAGPHKRGGRRLEWLDVALSPLKEKLPAADFQRLLTSLSLMMGIESLVVLKDVCGLDADEAEKVTQWSARALLAGALAGHDPF